MLAHARHHDGAFWCAVTKFFQAELWLERRTRLALVVGQRKLFTPTTHATAPRADIGLSFARLQQVVDGLQHFFDHQSTVTNNWHIGATHLALLGGVDVDVDNFGVWRKPRHLAGDSVVEA